MHVVPEEVSSSCRWQSKAQDRAEIRSRSKGRAVAKSPQCDGVPGQRGTPSRSGLPGTDGRGLRSVTHSWVSSLALLGRVSSEISNKWVAECVSF